VYFWAKYLYSILNLLNIIPVLSAFATLESPLETGVLSHTICSFVHNALLSLQANSTHNLT
jgi:hypothetical protein